MALTIGTQLGSHEITALLGKGGMGEVYRARDLKLKREVAIKILPEEFSRDADRVSRFQREAEVLASLNHPNIAAIHDLEETDGTRYLVLELVEGETLADRIARGPIPVEEALAVAKQICEALEAAHERGIIHRDLKPANVKITSEGKVKVLDFGLAKAMENAPVNTTLSNSPTMLSGTMDGMILGTAAYMSPEQARGKTMDKRADIWAFGAVLYEMLTGRRLFQGETVSDTLASILTKEPNWDCIPVKARRLIQSCLEKDPNRRLRDIGDASRLLDDAPAEPAARPAWLAWAVAGVLLTTTLAFAYVHFRENASPPAEPVRFQVALPEKLQSADVIPSFAVSPDSRQIVFFAAGSDTKIRLWVRRLDSLDARPLQGTESEFFGTPFWSPDSRYVAFSAEGKLKKVDVSNGLVQSIADVSIGPGVCGSWSERDVIVFSAYGSPGIARVSAAGGSPSFLTAAAVGSVEGSHLLPRFLPDGQHFLYIRYSSAPEKSGIYLGSIDTAPDKQSASRLLPADSNYNFGLEYVPSRGSSSGQVIFESKGTLISQTFDERTMSPKGGPVPIAAIGTAYFSTSAGGLVYRMRNSAFLQPTWLDRSGKVLEASGEAGDYNSLALSPDAKHAALGRFSTTSDIWLLDLVRNQMTRFTSSPQGGFLPLWSPNGDGIVFEQEFALKVKAANGTGGEQLLVQAAGIIEPNDWSRDGDHLIYDEANPAGKHQLWVLPMAAGSKPFRFVDNEFNQTNARFSPTGRLVAYASDESGRFDIYVQPFNAADPPSTSPAEKWLVSKGGGLHPRWRSDEKELFYQADRKIMAVDVTTSPAFSAGEPKVLFDWATGLKPGISLWDVTPDGKRFFVAVTVPDSLQAPFNVVLNWPALLNKLFASAWLKRRDTDKTEQISLWLCTTTAEFLIVLRRFLCSRGL
jgi:serine/threonine protein kinase/Tol biopolymer transport system component